MIKLKVKATGQIVEVDGMGLLMVNDENGVFVGNFPPDQLEMIGEEDKESKEGFKSLSDIIGTNAKSLNVEFK